jgi:bifunctional non-homologous end joining protein LigD
MRLPSPMLARSGPLPNNTGWTFELKYDGFRAIVRTGNDYTVRSRRGWNMTERVSELAAIPADAVFDGELVALGEDDWPYFPAVCDRVLRGYKRIRLTYLIFDLLELDGEPTIGLPLCERRLLLDSLSLHGPHWQTSATFDDGNALLAVAVERGLEGVVAKRAAERYRLGERSWVKTKNRSYWRYGTEVEAKQRSWERQTASHDGAGM